MHSKSKRYVGKRENPSEEEVFYLSLKRISKNARLSAAIAMTLFSASVSTVYALPTDGKVQSGTAKFETSNDNTVMDITTSDRVAIDWTSFDIASGETVNFKQPGADSIALNRIIGEDASQIYGALNANGKVFLINPNGVLFGRDAQVNVGGLVASTAKVDDTFMKDFGTSTGGFALNIEEKNTAAIINQAVINAKIKDEGGLVVLHAANVENDGTITTDKGGKVQLAAGKTLNINYDSAKINFTVDGGLSEANVLNAGTISAQNGVIAMTARGANDVLSSVVNTENAKLEAKRLAVNEKGEITLDAGTGVLGISGTVDVSGTDGADGGTISAKGGSLYIDGTLNADGANGGTIATTADNMVVTNKTVISAAGNGKNGTWNVNTTKNVDIKDVNKNIDSLKKTLADAKKEDESNPLKAAKDKLDELGSVAAKTSDEILKDASDIVNKKDAASLDGVYKDFDTVNGYVGVMDKDKTESDKWPHFGYLIDTKLPSFLEAYGDLLKYVKENDTAARYDDLSSVNGSSLALAVSEVFKDGTNRNELWNTVVASVETGINWFNSDGKKICETMHAGAKNYRSELAKEVIRESIIETSHSNLNAGLEKYSQANAAYANGLKTQVGTNGVAISNKVLSNTLNGTNVNITTNNAHQLSTDIVVSKDITKSGDTATNLTLTADRNVVFNAGVASEKELNLTTKAGSKIEKTAGVREGELYGANIVKADITTNGDVTLENNSYIGFNDNTKARTISAKNVKFGGNVVLATGDTVTVKATENVTFGGSINSGNAYSYEKLTPDDIKDVVDYWEKARAKAKGNTEGGSAVGDSYLATITDGIEDSAVSAVLPAKTTAYVGGVADKWETDTTDGKRSRVWKWVDGPEAGQEFFTQTAQKAKSDTKTTYSYTTVSGEATNGYANFCSGEPNDDSYKQPVLSVGYTDTGRGETDYNTSRWDDLFNEDSGKVRGYIKETNLANSSINIEAKGDISLGAVGNNKALDTVNLAGKNVTLNGVLKAESSAVGAVKISAKEAFINNAGANAIDTKGTWQIFSETPEKDVFNGLNSNNTAIWKAEGTVDNGGKNTYSFAIQPTLTVKANDATKTYGDGSTGNGVTVTNSLAGMENAEEFKNAFTDTTNAAELLAGYTLTSDGFAKTATRRNGDYKDDEGNVVTEKFTPWEDTTLEAKPYYEINVVGAANNTGYKVETEKGKLTVERAKLKLYMNDITVDYGTSYTVFREKYSPEVEGLKNNDSLDQRKFKTNAYETYKRTKNVGKYGVYYDGLKSLVYNYDVDYKAGAAHIAPKDVTLSFGGAEILPDGINILEGTPTYESQLVNGDTTDNAPKISYGTTGLGDGLSYGVDYYVNGEKISNGDTVGNYRFNYDDSTVIKLNNPENRRVQTLDMMKMAAALKGNADFDLDLSNAAVEGVDNVAGLMDGQLPGFKVVGQNVVPCGVFEISTTPDAVKVTQKPATAGATAAEPERGANQYRELSKMLDTVDGAANFTLTYNGSRFQIYPDGKEAQALLAKGESEGNVNVAAAALRSAFKEMGLSLEDMDAIYVHMDKDNTALYN